MIGFCPLASGSKGNAIYLGTPKTKILIDAGISLRDLTCRLNEIGVDISQIRAILITHEHIDHIRGLVAICRKWGIPVFANKETAQAILQVLYTEGKEFPVKFKIFSTGEPFQFEDIKVTPFSIQHDAIEPVAFTFEVEGVKIGVCADLGFASSLVLQKLQRCDYLYLEANHEPSMVHACARPMVYKQRVLSRQGHLSNQEAAAVLTQVYHPALKHVHLAHLSSECNAPDVALRVIRTLLASEDKELELSICPQEYISVPVHFALHVGEIAIS
jgi:phosphoribosyl 1,2-cyclic phosphodiesterase